MPSCMTSVVGSSVDTSGSWAGCGPPAAGPPAAAATAAGPQQEHLLRRAGQPRLAAAGALPVAPRPAVRLLPRPLPLGRLRRCGCRRAQPATAPGRPAGAAAASMGTATSDDRHNPRCSDAVRPGFQACWMESAHVVELISPPALKRVFGASGLADERRIRGRGQLSQSSPRLQLCVVLREHSSAGQAQSSVCSTSVPDEHYLEDRGKGWVG